MKILLVRHGNTFEEGSPSVWIGNRTDLPLTAIGRAKAEKLGSMLADARIPIAAVYTGNLKRHRQHGTIIAQALGRSEHTIIPDDRLREIEYGAWEGKSDEELRRDGRGDVLDVWNQKAVWPADGSWGEDEKSIQQRVDNFLASAEHCVDESVTLVVVTSGGVLRYIYKKVAGNSAPEGRTSKVSPGNVCSLSRRDHGWSVLYWNVPPGEITL